jgi:hypothetical protein
MPRYLVETDAPAATELDAAVHLAGHRFPEIDVQRTYITHDTSGPQAWWVCRAPSESHLGRWAAAAGLRIASRWRVDGPSPAGAVIPTTKE